MYFVFLFLILTSCAMKNTYVHEVQKVDAPFEVNANWDKEPWNQIKALELKNHMGDLPGFVPKVQLKLCYTNNDLFLIYKVEDKFVRCITTEINGPVWEDSTVEFFFAPDSDLPLRYFNIEINCGGTYLFYYNIIPRKDRIAVDALDMQDFKIAHSLPEVVDPEITDDLTWTIECRIPFELLKKYSNVTLPAKNVKWKANFYKIAVITSNPHYLTWTEVINDKPDFHLPAYFGDLVFR